MITSQHGLQRTRYRRVGSGHDHRQEVRKLEEKLEEVRREREHLRWREENLMRELREAHLGYQGGRR